MIKKLLGYVLTGVGLLGFFYFKNYTGSTIPLPMLWLVLSIAVALIGAYFVLTGKTKRQIQNLNEAKTKISRIKEKGERIVLDLDNCELKKGTITQLDSDSFSRVKMIDAVYDPNRSHADDKSSVIYIVYNHKNGDSVEKFVSQPFSVDYIMLKYYTSKNKIVLYVDRFDRAQYFFNIE